MRLGRRAILLAVAASAVQIPSPPPLLRLPAPGRVVAIGDVHGDIDAFLATLNLAGLANSKGAWSGGDAVLVQTGDVLDRGDDEPRCLELLRELKAGAAAAGGRVVTLLGNHEVLNALGELAYVSPVGMRQFGADRAKAFAPGSELARELAEWPVACVVGDGAQATAFCHAGLTSPMVARIETVNEAARRWLVGDAPPPMALLPTPDSPVWERRYSSPSDAEPPAATCAELRDALQLVGAERLVVGHTVQNRINGACGGAVYRIDVGMSIGMGGGLPEALEIGRDGRVTVLTEMGSRPADAGRETARTAFVATAPAATCAEVDGAVECELPPPPASRCEAVDGSVECEVS